MKTRLKNRTRKQHIVTYLIDELGYFLLSFTSLVFSAVSYSFKWQFITLAVILGIKWISTDRNQIIQIFTENERI